MRFLGSITNRIFLASALLAMCSIGAAVYLVSARLTSQTEAELRSDLTEAVTLINDERETEFGNVLRTARLIADLPRFKAAVDLADRPTLVPIAADYRLQADADLLMITGRRGELLALVGETTAKPVGEHTDDISLVLDGNAAPVFWVHPNGVLEVGSVPIVVGPTAPTSSAS
jgi:hypothetical protein